MPSLTTLRALFRHNDWARERLLDAAAALDPEALDRPFDMGCGSLRETLHHLAGCERAWLERWRGGRADAGDKAPTLADLGAAWQTTAQERTAYLDEMGDQGEWKRISFVHQGTDYTFPLGDMMLHVCNHGCHHRAQALNMLRHLGREAPMLDYLFFRIQSAPRPEISYEIETVTEYFRYGEWATGAVFECLGELDDTDLDRPFEMGMGSLRKTLLHVYDAKRWWLANWTQGRGSASPGRVPAPYEESSATMPLDELHERLTQVEEDRRGFCAGLTNEGLGDEVTAVPAPGHTVTLPLGDTMLQIGGHGTHHRAQAVNMLRGLGRTAPPLDYIDYREEVSGTSRAGAS